ncbi:MAG: methyl-accepting chemotaxis protein [Planctomycetota bacterium]|jgi:hypothetical protein
MRGRLSLLLMAVVVVPMVAVGLIAWHLQTGGETDGDGRVRDDEIEAAMTTRVNRAVVGLEQRLAESLRDFRERTVRLDGVSASDIEQAFGDLPEQERPSIVLELDGQGTPRPSLSDDLRSVLSEPVASSEVTDGYVLLPEVARSSAQENPGVSAPIIYQYIIAPRGGAERLVVARPVRTSVLFGTPSGDGDVKRGLVLLTAAGEPPPASSLPADLDAALVARAAREVAQGRSFQEGGEHGAMAAVALRDPLGRPVALAFATYDGSDVLPLIRRQSALLSSMLSIVGLMCVVGVIAAVLMGMLAPRLVWRDIRKSTDFIYRSADRLRELVQRNQGALDEQSTLTRSLMESVASLEAASKDVLRTAGSLAHKAEQSAWVSQTGNQKAELAQRSVLEVRERVVDLSSQMEELGRRCDEIGSLTSFINHLSTETNALSINATIHAAGSGGSGRQHAIMAGEIQRLADLSQDSTRDINHLVERIQQASRSTLEASKDGCEQVDRAKACYEELEAAFARILRWVEETTQAAHGIEHSTEEQAGSLQNVGQTIERLEQHSRFTTGNFQDIVLAADELAQLGSEMNETWKVG